MARPICYHNLRVADAGLWARLMLKVRFLNSLPSEYLVALGNDSKSMN